MGRSLISLCKVKFKHDSKLDLVPCPYVEYQNFDYAELFCDIQECNTCPMKFLYFQTQFKEHVRRYERLKP